MSSPVSLTRSMGRSPQGLWPPHGQRIDVAIVEILGGGPA